MSCLPSAHNVVEKKETLLKCSLLWGVEVTVSVCVRSAVEKEGGRKKGLPNDFVVRFLFRMIAVPCKETAARAWVTTPRKKYEKKMFQRSLTAGPGLIHEQTKEKGGHVRILVVPRKIGKRLARKMRA